MSHRILVPAVALFLGLAAGLALPVLAEDQKAVPGHQVIDPDATVTAHRYEIAVFDSAMDFVHAHGRTIVELHFPKSGIVCNLGEAPLQGVVVNAFYGAPRNGLDPKIREMLGENAPKRVEPEEVEVPASLFVRVKVLADTRRELDEYATKLKSDLAETGLFARKE